jgi:hypothetical protein
MKSIGLPKLKSGKESSTEPPPRNLLADIASIGVFLLIGMGAILAISDALPKKGATREPDPAALNAQNMREDTVDVGSRPANLDPPVRTISDDPSSPLTQDPVIRGLPGSPYHPPPTRKPVLRRFGTESDASERLVQRQFSMAARRPRFTPDSKRKWPKAFIMYLEAHQNYLRKLRR